MIHFVPSNTNISLNYDSLKLKKKILLEQLYMENNIELLFSRYHISKVQNILIRMLNGTFSEV